MQEPIQVGGESPAVAYRRAGSLAIAFRQIVSRSRGIGR